MPAGCEVDAIAFYGEVLGLTEVKKPAELVANGGCWFENDLVRVHLGVDPDFRPARKADPALVVSDLSALLDTVRARAGAVTEAPAVVGYRRAFVDDPFGNRLELMERDGE